MEANTAATSIDAVILAAGMTCFAAECDVIVMKRSPRAAAEPFVAVSAVSPPFAGD